MTTSSAPLLEARHLSTMLRGKHGVVTAVDNVSLRVDAGRSLALVGESGSGKSMTCNTLLGLLPSNGRLVQGEVLYKGQDLAKLPRRAMEKIRGREIGMILQDAMTSLNPLMTIGDQVAEIFRVHQGIRDKAELRRLCVEVLERVKIPAARERLDSYPFQFSGGMRQRVSIAINIALSPELLICDEPTTALDVTVQLQILKLLRELQQQRNMALIFVTHDLHLASQFCDDVAIMYGGRIVEAGPIADVFAHPAHPYTAGLLNAVPSLGHYERRLEAIPGQQPGLADWPEGCRFAPRCQLATEQCRTRYPDWFEWQSGERRSACWETVRMLSASSASETHGAGESPATRAGCSAGQIRREVA
ncbi:ABC transporter ATP-binding protein [Pandoraea fibrosis]|uniref:Oligopeptide transport ATP-binding protein OppD n=1 Tax=Pandoraea fibrosis TaxID=1891094 RepID=A0A5E4S382_9BURK|nr:ABC transporter ATP-binding protein [Pandoraea fibrosis]VVD69641.1 Oligopeptide transport ATP-binding protein OppD [Pandoraea fibrosis]